MLIMTQLVVSIEDSNLIADIKRAIKLLRDVSDVFEDETPNSSTAAAIREAEEGKTVKCMSFEDYLEKVK